jgi:hypothetical protein
MSFAVARVGSIVKVDGKTGSVITGASSHFVDGGGAGSGPGGVAPDVLVTEGNSMETEDMTPAERHAYLAQKYGEGTADAIERATTANAEDPGSDNVSAPNAQSKDVTCGEFSNSSPDSTKISRYYTVADFSSATYQSSLSHAIPNTTAKNMARADVICNLKFLATNSIDPLKDWLAANGGGLSFKIGSGFRNNTNGSDHNIGSAVDLHFFNGGTRIGRDDLRQIAKKILNSANIPFTQFLLEFQGDSSPGWMHIANRKTGGNSSLRIGYTMTGSSPYHANLPRSA